MDVTRHGEELSALRIWNPYRTTEAIYATTIHELAHASHWLIDNRYYNGDEILFESWARGVQWDLSRIRYINYTGGATVRPSYTQVVVDMIDPSEIPIPNSNRGLRVDNVQGYTIQQLEHSLHNVNTWNQWKSNIINLYQNDTENNLDALFAYWN
jgi:hypothetical protein